MNQKNMRILGIESSCDETSAAVVTDGRIIQSSVIASQIDLHAKFGGVFPELASREHVRAIYPIVDQALHEAHISMAEIDAIAVTRGPGLAGSLVVGVNFAKGLAIANQKPLLGINHLEGHIYAAWLYKVDAEPQPEPQFPLLALLVSGGHSELVLMKDHLTYQRLGGTLDDAAGEAFDKVARLLELPYPGGPSIQKAGFSGNPQAFNFPRARLEGTWDFSFSGLKTAVLRMVEGFRKECKPLPTADLAASFQAAVVDALVEKTMAAAEAHQVHEIVIAGGVSANRALREAFLANKHYKINIPSLALCTDNAAMIAGAGYYRHLQNKPDDFAFDVKPTWHLA